MRAELGAKVERARADMADEDGQGNRRILGAVDRPGQPLLAPDELRGIELEPGARRRQADDDAQAAVPRPAERHLRRLRVADRIEGVIDAVRKVVLHERAEAVGLRDVRRAETAHELQPLLVGIHADDVTGARDACALDDELADAAGSTTSTVEPASTWAAKSTAPTPVSAAQPSSAASSSGTPSPSGSATCSETTSRSESAPVAVPR